MLSNELPNTNNYMLLTMSFIIIFSMSFIAFCGFLPFLVLILSYRIR